MKKKLNARKKREAFQKAKKEKFAQKTAPNPKGSSAPPAAEAPDTKSEKPLSKKSYNKAAGLKSTLVVCNELYLTSFGKGNAAVIEQKIEPENGYRVTGMQITPSITVNKATDESVRFRVKRKIAQKDEFIADNPMHEGRHRIEPSAGSDMLGLKTKLEKYYFGKEFDDNLHNILDIEKILAVYSTNITAGLDHIAAEATGNKRTDCVAEKVKTPYNNSLEKYRSYVKDYVKALNSPFGYNIPRFENLTIEELFDKNEHPVSVDK